MSKEGIYLLSKSYGAQSTREDVPVDFLLKSTLREPGKEYLWMDSEDWDLETPKRREVVKQIFTPILSR